MEKRKIKGKREERKRKRGNEKLGLFPNIIFFPDIRKF